MTKKLGNRYYEQKWKQEFETQQRAFQQLLEIIEQIALRFDCDADRLYTCIMCMIIKSMYKLSYRRLETYFKVNKSARKLCNLKYCPARATLHSFSTYLAILEEKHGDIYHIILQMCVDQDAFGSLVGDSTGFAIDEYIKWLDVRNNHELRRNFVKLHILASKNGKIVSFIATKGTQHDSPMFREMCKYIPKGSGYIALDSAYDAN